MPASVVLRGLTIEVGDRRLVDEVGLQVHSGQVVGLVGSSGSGKTLTARALLGLVDLEPGVVRADLRVQWEGQRFHPYEGRPRTRRERARAFASLRGDVLGYLPQDAPRTLDPLSTVAAQLARVARLGRAPERALGAWLEAAGFTAAHAEEVLPLYPHELSGGMGQRVAIALALARGSRFLIVDEPTTGLDAPVQHRLLQHLRALAHEGLGVVVVTHDLRWLGEVADAVVVLDQGRRVEALTSEALTSGQADSGAARRLLDAVRRLQSPGFPS